MSENSKKYVLLSTIVITFIATFFMAPWPQNPMYHNFADQRGLLGIHNCNDVLSNIPFIFTGLLGVLSLQKYQVSTAKLSWMVFFIGVILVAPGSAYYHYMPDNIRLVWDRLPMTIGFMGLFVAMLTTYISEKIEIKILPIALIAGFSSVIYWAKFDDLRFYAWIQTIPLICIPMVLVMFKSNQVKKLNLALGLGFYLLAKITESNDVQIFQMTGGFISGHTLKHLLAAMAPLAIATMFKQVYLEKN